MSDETPEEAERLLNEAIDAVKCALPKGVACIMVVALREQPDSRAIYGNCGRGPILEMLAHAMQHISVAPEPPIVGKG